MQYGNMDRAFECFQRMSNIFPTLLGEVDTYYQLGCGDQPKGSMGDLSSLNVKHSSAPLLAMMKRLSVDAGTSETVKRLDRKSRSTAYFALATLAYGTREFGVMRRFLRKAVLNDLKLLFNGHLVSLWGKSLLGPRVVDGLKSIRQRAVSD
jgi:hypothetical protein